MSYIIHFRESDKRHGVIRFVKSYQKGGFLKRERITYTYDIKQATLYGDFSLMAKIRQRIYKDFPEAKVDESTREDFTSGYDKHRFWVLVNKTDGSGMPISFYCGEKKGQFLWTEDINEALIGLDFKTQAETAMRIKMHYERVFGTLVYLDIINDLLNPNFMITCESKSGKKEIKFFARREGNRLRLVETSAAAAKFSYGAVLAVYDELKTYNKNFLYSVLPIFKDNVSYKNLKEYLKGRPVSNRVMMELKLSGINPITE